MRKITIKDIAKASSVSETTVSRYLNGKFEYMSADTKIKIEQVITELNYRPNNIARMLKSKQSKTIGAIIGDIENPFSSVIIKGLSDECEALGYSLLVAVTDESVEKEQQNIERYIDNSVDGIIVNTCGNNEDYLNALNDTKYPLVLLDRGITDNTIDTVTTNNFEIGSIAMNYLLETGYNSIGFFVHPLENSVRLDRARAFQQKRKEASASEQYIIERGNNAALYNALIEFRKLPEPRVIFSGNGFMTLSILDTMNDLNYKVNKDFGIIGYDELAWSRVVGNGITTIAQSAYDIARKSCELLVKKIEDEQQNSLHIAQFIEFPGKLKIRNSTKI